MVDTMDYGPDGYASEDAPETDSIGVMDLDEGAGAAGAP
jgi:hypothetical protein